MNFADHQDLADRKRRRRRRRRSDMVWNFLTICVFLAAFVLIGGMLLIFSNPYIALNPFPPPTMPVLVMLPTSTPTLVQLPPTWTPTVKIEETQEPLVVTTTSEPVKTDTPIPVVATTAVVNITDDNADYPFELQGAPAELRSVVFKPETGCQWQGVAGQVVDLQGKPLVQIAVELSGIYNGRTVDMKTITGTHTEYGESGYEFQLNNNLVESTGSLSIQLVDQSYLPLSEKVVFNTYATCDKNLIIINFKQVR